MLSKVFRKIMGQSSADETIDQSLQDDFKKGFVGEEALDVPTTNTTHERSFLNELLASFRIPNA